MNAKPVIAVPACRRILEPHPFHMVGEKYLQALTDSAGAVPMIIPVMVDDIAIVKSPLDREGVFLLLEPTEPGGLEIAKKMLDQPVKNLQDAEIRAEILSGIADRAIESEAKLRWVHHLFLLNPN